MQATGSEAPIIDQFIQDAPREIGRSDRIFDGVTIEGVVLERLSPNTDDRGALIELMTTRDGPIEPIVHVYQVIAGPGSLRGWVYHKWQSDRLHFTLGDFEIQLFDIRPDAPNTWTPPGSAPRSCPAVPADDPPLGGSFRAQSQRHRRCRIREHADTPVLSEQP